MTLVYGIIWVLAAIVGSVTGRALTRYIAKKRAEKRFEKLLSKALEEAADEIIKEMADKRKDMERIQLYETIESEKENGCWESYEIQKTPRGYIVALIGHHGVTAIDIPRSFTDEDLNELHRHLFNCGYKRLERM